MSLDGFGLAAPLHNNSEAEFTNAIWGDEETRKFYEDLPPLRDVLPAALVGVGSGLCAVNVDDDADGKHKEDDAPAADEHAEEEEEEEEDDDDMAVRALLPSSRSTDGDGVPLPLSGASHLEQVRSTSTLLSL